MRCLKYFFPARVSLPTYLQLNLLSHFAWPRALALASTLVLTFASGAGPAAAQSATVSTAALGTVTAAVTGVTTFRFAPATGAVTVVSGSGTRNSTGAVRFGLSIACTSGYCTNKNMIVSIASIGTPTGRAGALTNFTVSPVSNATIVSAASGTNPMNFTLGPIGAGNTATLYIGADLPIYGDDSTTKATGNASSSIIVTTTDDKGKSPATSLGAATAKVVRHLTISSPTALNFGRVIKPASGNGSVVLPASTGTRTVAGGIGLATPAPSRATFTTTGEGGQAISISVPTTITMSNGSGGTINVTTSNTAQGAQLLSNNIGGSGSFTFYVGGAFAMTNSTPTGAFTGTYNVTVSYN